MLNTAPFFKVNNFRVRLLTSAATFYTSRHITFLVSHRIFKAAWGFFTISTDQRFIPFHSTWCMLIPALKWRLPAVNSVLCCGKLKTPRVIYEDSARDESNIVDGWIHNTRACVSHLAHICQSMCRDELSACTRWKMRLRARIERKVKWVRAALYLCFKNKFTRRPPPGAPTLLRL